MLLALTACGAYHPGSATVVSTPVPTFTTTFEAPTRRAATATPAPYPGSADDNSYPAPTIEKPPTSYPASSPAPLEVNPTPSLNWPTPTITPIAGPFMPTRVAQMVFVDQLHGWIVGEVKQESSMTYAMAATEDGGKRWQAIPVPPLHVLPHASAAFGVQFADANNGWFYFGQLFSTHDGGHSWLDEHAQGEIVQMEKTVHGELWAVEAKGSGWTLLEVSVAPYSSWKRFEPTWPIGLDRAHLAVADWQHLWLYYWTLPENEAGAPYISRIFASYDGGKSWQDVVSPCNAYATIGGAIVAIDQRNLWLSCTRPWGAGSGSKYIFRSVDAGKSWAIVGKAGGPNDRDNNLSLSGYLGNFGALSSSFAYMTWLRTPLVITTGDGGKTWAQCSPLPVSMDYQQVVFIDPLHGWTYEQSFINRTIDGGRNWECVMLPDNRPCP